MPIEKISFSGVEQTQTKPESKKEYIQKETPVEDTEKSKAAKYMIGAAALAGVVAIGIIGHKNNWWRKAQDIGEDIANKGSEAVQNVERKVGKTLKTPSAGSNADEIKNPNSNTNLKNPDEIPVETPKTEHLDSVPEKGPEVNAEFLDFSKLEGERSVRDGMHVISQKDQNGKLLREYISKDNKTISSIDDYDPSTGKQIKETYYAGDGKTIWYVSDYDPSTGKQKKVTYYADAGKTIWYVSDYDPSTGKRIKSTNYYNDGKTIRGVKDYDPATGLPIKSTNYYNDGKTISSIDDYDPSTGKQIKETYYAGDGKTISWIDDYDPYTGKQIKETSYYDDGKTIMYVSDYDPSTGKRIKSINYYDDGKTIKKVETTDPFTGIEKITNYDTDGNVI